MAGLLARLRSLIPGPLPSEDVDAMVALGMAYQHQLAELHAVRGELDQVAAARRRLDVARRQQSVPSASAATRDAALAAEQLALVRVVASLRGHLESFRAERDAIAAEPDPDEAARRAREALGRWRTATDEVIRDAVGPDETSGDPWHDPLATEPAGLVADQVTEPQRYEQPPRASSQSGPSDDETGRQAGDRSR
ncbi:MAG: hypothetical protein IPO80_02155 [Propionibacteriaceae bacterium]|nr:hypothetical protein [Propionibacteriaceae bacterium]